MTVGTLVLAVGAFFTTKAHNKKYVTATSAYYTTAGGIYTVFKGVTGIVNLTTVKGAGACTFFIRACVGGAVVKLFANRSGTMLSKTIFTK